MRELFESFYRPADEQFVDLWENGIISLDANVLLNIYRYPEAARNELLDVLEQVKDRLWIPHHAALEFYRNRVSVIAEQKTRFRELRELLVTNRNKIENDVAQLRLKERHATINPEKFLEDLSKLFLNFSDDISKLEAEHMDITDADPLLERLDDIIGDRVGPTPTTQGAAEIKLWAEERFKTKMPPGFQDKKKSESGEDKFNYGGILYEKQHGDAILWHQLLSYAKDEGPKGIIFVTDDTKDDWWNIISHSGDKTIGPRPELSEEMARVGGVSSFYIYRTYRFLDNAKERLNSAVSVETIEHVKDVSASSHSFEPSDMVAIKGQIESDLKSTYRSSIVSEDLFPDFIVSDILSDEETFGVEMLLIRNASKALGLIRARIGSLTEECNPEKFTHIDLYLIVGSDSVAIDLFASLRRLDIKDFIRPKIFVADRSLGFLDLRAFKGS